MCRLDMSKEPTPNSVSYTTLGHTVELSLYRVASVDTSLPHFRESNCRPGPLQKAVDLVEAGEEVEQSGTSSSELETTGHGELLQTDAGDVM